MDIILFITPDNKYILIHNAFVRLNQLVSFIVVNFLNPVKLHFLYRQWVSRRAPNERYWAETDLNASDSQ